jgi:4-alpha-glucanotransferase
MKVIYKAFRMIKSRGYGIFLHVTSLPSPYGVGDFGYEAIEFLDLLEELKACCWQILPLVPTSSYLGNAPYSSESSFALNSLLLSPDYLAEEGFVSKSLVESLRKPVKVKADYKYGYKVKAELVRRAYEKYKSNRGTTKELVDDFVQNNKHWIIDYALFRVLRERYGSPWTRWPVEYRSRRHGALERFAAENTSRLEYVYFEQFLLWEQWESIHREARSRRISIIGDIPYYVTHDSSDVWAHQHLFKLDSKGNPLYVGGVPPDAFSSTGQLWGMPVYDWEAHRQEGFHWWIERLGHSLRLFDLVRLDHFRGLIGYWEVPAGSKTAIPGKWVKTPYEEFFKVLARTFPMLPFIAEDLGFITPDVREARKMYHLFLLL